MAKNNNAWIGIGIVLVVIVAAVLLLNRGQPSTTSPGPGYTNPITVSSYSNSTPCTQPMRIIAAENFWGSLVSQLGRNVRQCYEHCHRSQCRSARVRKQCGRCKGHSKRKFIIVNGVGYDDWALKLISASSNPNQTVLNVAKLLGSAQRIKPAPLV